MCIAPYCYNVGRLFQLRTLIVLFQSYERLDGQSCAHSHCFLCETRSTSVFLPFYMWYARTLPQGQELEITYLKSNFADYETPAAVLT
jgi:hypothetical protein